MIPSKLKMENFFSHKDSEIDFSKFSSALLIGNTEGDYNKSNGSGKSAVFEAILWCLFNKSRAAMMDEIVRWGETTCSVTLTFKHSDSEYMVRRNRNRMNSTSSVEFFILNKAGEWQDISGSTSGDTNLKIESTIKLDHKTFINSVYFRQNDISEFAESEPSRKKDILKSIVDISRWDDYDKISRKKARDINVECKVLRKSVQNYDSVVEKLEQVRLEIKESKRKSSSLSSSLKVASEELESLGSQYALIKKSLDTDTYDKVVEQLKTLKKNGKKYSEKRADTQSRISKHAEDIAAIELKISSLKGKIGDRELVEVSDDDIEGLRTQLTDFKSKKQSSEEMLMSISQIEISDGICYTCNQPVDSALHAEMLNKHQERESRFKAALSESNKKILEIEIMLEDLLRGKRSNAEIEKIHSSLDSLKYKLDIAKESRERLDKEFDDLTNSIEQVRFKIKNNNNILESIKNDDFQALRLKIRELRDQKESLSAQISEEDKSVGRLMERESLLVEQESAMRSDKAKISKMLERIALFDKLSKAFGKGGIQTILLDAVIEDLETTANKTLASICNEPAVIVLETQRVGSDGSSIVETLDLKVRKDGHLQNFKSLSGGEKFRISLALRIALSDISSRYGGSSLEFLLLDEVNSPLDRFGVETLFVNVIKSLEDRYKILVITHDESLKERFDNVINITKVNGESELEFIER